MMPSAARVVAHRRMEPADSLDFFPTPPWATRAPFVHIIGRRGFQDLVVEDPCCGEGHMAYPLADFFGEVRASDIFPYGWGEVRDYHDADAWADIPAPDWTVMNSPFGDKALPFIRRALTRSRIGVAAFVRTTQLGGINRYRYLYRGKPPEIVAPFVERVPIYKGRWVPEGKTFTDYMWLIWRLDRPTLRTETVWIPPVCKATLHFQRDLEDLTWSNPPADESAAFEGDAE